MSEAGEIKSCGDIGQNLTNDLKRKYEKRGLFDRNNIDGIASSISRICESHGINNEAHLDAEYENWKSSFEKLFDDAQKKFDKKPPAQQSGSLLSN